ncbi:hypothetical protein TPHA_0C04560 [Tetrapisispora phaffii CBS 4417]|uniref:Alpha-1,2-mannosyltransferase MNN2 n=1 Tax=Tetrapisispora phaffii (strain ATCC 24235 / CBS 4417 / NBRC 1672 / NRRL Y-8282 / UCD 70-5) TaxID=1071381 RepID=G8BQU4_TETPH|nr:hypothetical protein TPHA_0C04560 [Tetrapisispora phaffii CBS 4417]CCE62606.1 hypothetical protein TPHA_0C04560 [Tetrapisispora phaffii CBS 4417]
MINISGRRFSRLFKISAIVLCVFIISAVFLSSNRGLYNVTGLENNNEPSFASDPSIKKTFSSIFDAIKKHSPDKEVVRKKNDNCLLDGTVGTGNNDVKNWHRLSQKSMEGCLELSDSEINTLKSKHDAYIQSLEEIAVEKIHYKGKGIAIVGGGKFSLLAFLVVKTIRKFETTLPIEIFIPPQDVEDELEFCQQLLPEDNAKCIYLSDILPSQDIKKYEFKRYQYKSLAILASSFDDLLLIDADNFPIKNLDGIFDNEPYTSTGLILWPDFWRRSANPKFYEITGIELDTKKRVRNAIDDLTPPEVYTEDFSKLADVPFHDFSGTLPDPSTESGQMMINKGKHMKTLLLALYYNVNGPSWYYPILSQGAAGEGDKETVIAAALHNKAKFYQVKFKTGVEGYHQSNGRGFRGVAMLQHDFVQDFARYEDATARIKELYSTESFKQFDSGYSIDAFYEKYISQVNTDIPEEKRKIDVLFVHSHLPKFDPVPLWQSQDLIEDGKHFRSYTSLKKINYFDIELQNFEIFDKYICQDTIAFPYIKNEVKDADMPDLCNYIKNRLSYLQETHESVTSVA